jgi:hypothetical protein
MMGPRAAEQALRQFIAIVNKTGGIVKREDGHWRLARFPEDDTGLAGTYIKACQSLGIEPRWPKS